MLDLGRIVKPVVVRVGFRRVGGSRNLHGIRKTVIVRIGKKRACAVFIDLAPVSDAVPIAVARKGIGAEFNFLSVNKAVAVRVRIPRIRPRRQFVRVGKTIAVRVGGAGVGVVDEHLVNRGKSVSIPVGVCRVFQDKRMERERRHIRGDGVRHPLKAAEGCSGNDV